MTALAGSTGTAREVTLTMGDFDALVTIERVVVVGTAPADNPQRKILLLSDVRWYFTRAWMCLDVNLRRRVGDTHLIGNVLDPVLGGVADTIAYAPWSIDNGVAYDWISFTEQVLDYLTDARHGRPSLVWVLDTFNVVDVNSKIVQETSIDAPGPVAVAHAIESIPGASIYVDLEGTIHVYERAPGAEIPVVEALPPDLQGHGDLVKVDNSSLRPVGSASSFRIYVDYEVEVRFTYNFSGGGLWGTLSHDDPYLLPVIQVTDASLFIPAGIYPGLGAVALAARTVGQGSWITQAEAFAGWCWNGGSPAGPTYLGLTLPVLTDDIVAKHWCGDGLENYAGFQVDALFDPVWSKRIDELMRCYRTIFRINPRFWDRIRHAWAIRAAVWDPITGQRAPAAVYSNFQKIPGELFSVEGGVHYYGDSVTDSYPQGAHEGLLAFGKPSGFRAHILDKELGIIEIDRNVLSKYPGMRRLILSPVKVGTGAGIDDGVYDVQAQELVSATSGASDDWKLAVVLSCAPAAPNDQRRMYEIKVSLADAAATAGISTPTGYGPDQEMRSHLSQARIAWQDDTGVYDEILALLGASDSTDGITSNDPVSALTPINLTQELQPLAKAIAAAHLLGTLDHYVGDKTVPMSGAIVPLGAITRVTHKVLENRAVTLLHCSRYPTSFSAIDFLKGSARALLLHEIQNQQR